MDTPDIEQRLQKAERSLLAHDFLLRALLTHLAMADPQSFRSLVGGFANSRLYRSSGSAGELTRDVAEELTALVEDIARSLR